MDLDRLKECTQCGASVAANQNRCPKCGGPLKLKTLGKAILGVLLLMLIIGLFTGNEDNSEVAPSKDSTPAEPVSAGGPREITKEFLGCKEKEVIEKLSSLAAQGDKEAFATLYVIALQSGECREFQPGEKVYLEDVEGFFGGIVKIRKEGELMEFYIVQEAVSSP